MPPQSTTLNACTNDVSQAKRHGKNLLHHSRHLPNAIHIQPPHMGLPQLSLALPQVLVDKIMNTQEAAVSETAQAMDASRLREFLQFCEGHGITSTKAFPAEEDLLIAWAASYAGRLAGKTVSAKLRAVRKEHERRGLVWQGGVLLRRTLKGVEELRPISSYHSKRTLLVKPAALKQTVDGEFDDSSQSDGGGDDDKAESAIIVEDSSESDSDDDVKMVESDGGGDGDKVESAIIIEDSSESDSDDEVKMVNAVSVVNGLNKRKATDDTHPQVKKVKLQGDAPVESKTIFVGRLSWFVDNDWLAQEFAHCGEVESANVQMDYDSGKSRGFGYVQFTTSEAVEKALLMDGQEIDGRAVKIARDRRDHQTSPPSSTLFIGNLSFDASEDTVWTFFDDYGVKRVRIPTDPDTGWPKGFGYVEFRDVYSAKKAFEAANGAYIEGRSIRLDYYSQLKHFSGGRGGGRGFSDRGGRGGFRGRGGFDRGRGGFGDRGRGGRGGDRGRGRASGAPRGVSKNGSIAAFKGKKITFEDT